MLHSPHFADDEDLQEVPNQFDSNCLNPSNFHQTPQFSSSMTQRKTQNVLTPKKINNEKFFNKTQQYINLKKQKIGNLKAEIQQKSMADCTFQPIINRNKSKSFRNFQQFLDSQLNHQAKIVEKKNNLRQRIEDQNLRMMPFSPVINKKKQDVHNKENVHERLYRLKDKDKELQMTTYDHIPKITEKGQRVVRNLPIDELLYEDARRRAQRHNHYKLETQQRVKQKNSNIQKFAAQKFLKDFNAVLEQLNYQQKEQFEQNEFNMILHGLGYSIYTADQKNALALEQHELVRQAFMFLQRSGVTQANLFVFLLSIGGIYDVQIAGKSSIDQEQGSKIHAYFDTLFRNRLFNDYSKKLGRTAQKDQSPFKPTINPDSTSLAEKYRCKMIERANSIFAKNSIDIQIPDKGLAHGDLLVIYNLGQNLQKQKMREDKKQQKDPQCTFQPNSQKYLHQNTYLQGIGAEKCHDLYEQAKARQAEVNKINSALPAFLEQSTIKKKSVSPKASKVNKHSTPTKSQVKSYLEIKDVDKTLARMAIGRQMRNQKRQFEQRGEKASSKQHQSKKRASECMSRQREILFDVDVSINGVNKKILIYSEDRNRIPEVVAEFSQECGLDINSQQTLEQQLLQAVADLPNQQ